jgi:hypothetical protein
MVRQEHIILRLVPGGTKKRPGDLPGLVITELASLRPIAN